MNEIMKNICFVANFYNTPTYSVIAKQLEKYQISPYWIVPKLSQYKWLVSDYGDNKVLLIDRSIIKKDNPPLGDYKLNELIYGDRVWRYEKKIGHKYLINLQKPIYDFIKKNRIQMIFGEDTWAQELLIHRMCNQIKDLHCQYVSQMVARIPNNYYFFFTDEKQVHYLKKTNGSTATSVHEINVERPSYLITNNKINENNRSFTGVLNRLKRFFTGENIEATDPNVIVNRWIRLKVMSKEVINQKTYFFIKRTNPEKLIGLNYVLFGFHKQPEASIDVCGRYFENQMENVINIWRQLPPDWYLVIKEHSNAIGDRGYNFFRKLQKYPHLIIVNEYANSQELIKQAQLVITNTGTMALESALMGVPAITLSEVVFNCLNYCRHCTWQDFEKYDSLKDLVTEIKTLPNNKDIYTKLVNENSYCGEITDVISNPLVLGNRNITKIVNAFMSLINQ